MARILGIVTQRPVGHDALAGQASRGLRHLADAVSDALDAEQHVGFGDRLFVSLFRRRSEPPRVQVDPASGVMLICDGAPQDGGRVLSTAELLGRYLESGAEGMAAPLDGAWIIVIADPRHDRLQLIRDRIGLKPIYFAETDNGLAFGSNAGSIVRAGWMPAQFDSDIVAKYASSNYRMVYGRGPTFFSGVRMLPPASILTYEKGTASTSTYWDLDPGIPYLDATWEELEVAYREGIASALERFLAPRGDEFVVSLSGGMDSSTMIGMLHVVTGRRVDAISCTYRQDTVFDETATILPSVEAHVERWHNHQPTGEMLAADIPTLYRRFDQPLATVSQYMGESVGHRIGELGYPVVFTGAGGDYLQAGDYPNFLHYFADIKASGDEALFRSEVEGWITHHGTPVYPKSFKTVEDFFDGAIDWSVPGLLKPLVLPLGAGGDFLDPSLLARVSLSPITVPSYGTYLRSNTAQEYRYEGLAPGIPSEDVTGWTYGFDAAEPYFARTLIDLGWRIPPNFKIQKGVNKVLARSAMRGIVPDQILDKTSKQGWNAPTDQWFRGPLKELVVDVVGSKSFRERGIYQPDKVDELLRRHLAGEANHMMLLWQVVNLELWMHEWIDP